MSQLILILGPSGTGKTSSLRNLPPAKTGLINVDKKPLPLQGWRKKYVNVIDETGVPDFVQSNYVETAKPASVKKTLIAWAEREDLDNLVIDTMTHMITHDYIHTAIGRDFAGYQELGKNFFHLLEAIQEVGKNVIVLGHSKTAFNDAGQKETTMVAHGKMIDAFVPPSYFTTVLMTHVYRDDEGAHYCFRTQGDSSDPAKSPAYFENNVASPALEYLMDNDIVQVLDKLEEFESKIN